MEHLAVADDLDRDGTRDLVILSRFDGRQAAGTPNTKSSEPEGIYVDAISGRDGHPLWWWRWELESERVMAIHAPFWWGRGPDGWPLLAVSLGGSRQVNSGQFSNQPGVVHVLEASTGRELHRVDGLLNAGVADLDGDGLRDLWGEAEGQLRAFRGPMPEAWRALGYFRAAGRFFGVPDDDGNHIADFDGDGIGDALVAALESFSGKKARGSRTFMARSGRDGHALWKTSIDAPPTWGVVERWTRYGAKAFGLPAGDLDGDGTCDVVITIRLITEDKNHRARAIPLDVLSGQTGRRLWSAGDLRLDLARPGNTLLEGLPRARSSPRARIRDSGRVESSGAQTGRNAYGFRPARIAAGAIVGSRWTSRLGHAPPRSNRPDHTVGS